MLYRVRLSVISAPIGTLIGVMVLTALYDNYLLSPPTLQEPELRHGEYCDSIKHDVPVSWIPRPGATRLNTGLIYINIYIYMCTSYVVIHSAVQILILY